MPAEGEKDICQWEQESRPDTIPAESTSRGQSNIHHHYATVFKNFGNNEISTGSTMMDQYQAHYV
eukprot:9560807-Karenia_brevis.AAC.1